MALPTMPDNKVTDLTDKEARDLVARAARELGGLVAEFVRHVESYSVEHDWIFMTIDEQHAPLASYLVLKKIKYFIGGFTGKSVTICARFTEDGKIRERMH